MSRRALLVYLVVVVSFLSGTLRVSALTKSAASRYPFSTSGALSQISAEDVSAIIKVVGEEQIFRLRVLTRSKVRVDLSANGHTTLEVLRIDGSWQPSWYDSKRVIH
jgi:hypothetical protein